LDFDLKTKAMITDQETNRVYLSEMLRKPPHDKFCDELETLLKSYGVDTHFLPLTRGIWCRDFMPAQIGSNEFIAYRYDPDYLQGKMYRIEKSYPDVICQHLSLPVTTTDIILDGGNIIRMKDYLVMTDKIFPENKPHYTKTQLIEALKKLFHVKDILLIPWDRHEKFGHADGMVRLLSDNKLLVNSYVKDNPFFKSFFKQLEKYNIDYELLSFTGDSLAPDKNWAYINYLQTDSLLLIPQFGIREDQQAMEALTRLFPHYAASNRIATIDATTLLNEGGALNCISWTIRA